MSTVVAVLGFAVLFAGFGLLAPVLRRRGCDGAGEGCGSCSRASCKYTEQEP